MSYVSPIKIGYTAEPEEGWTDKIGRYMAGEVDNLVLQSCVKVGCHVDKDELEKALRYDRGQYEKGYEDGKRDAAAAVDGLQSEVGRLKAENDELREAQTYIDHYGDKWMTSAKDVPTAAYNHGYMDGKGEAEAAQPHWVKCDEALPEIGQRVIVYDGWMQFMTRKDDQRLNGKMYWENEEGNWERVDDEAYWMPIEPPKE